VFFHGTCIECNQNSTRHCTGVDDFCLPQRGIARHLVAGKLDEIRRPGNSRYRDALAGSFRDASNIQPARHTDDFTQRRRISLRYPDLYFLVSGFRHLFGPVAEFKFS
jgi:hypothetical protein